MAIWIELTTEISPKFDPDGKSARKMNVRRPLRGVEIKQDTYGYLQLIRADGSVVKLYDSGSRDGRSDFDSNFMIQQVQEPRMEKHQIIETFGETFLFFFGEAPRFLSVTAVLVNTFDFNWEAEWTRNYDEYLRGTKCIEQGAKAYLFYDDNVFEGFILNATLSKESQGSPYLTQLQFQFFVTSHRNVSMIGDPNFPLHDGAWPGGDGSLDYTKELTPGGLLQLKGEGGLGNNDPGNFLRRKALRSKIADNSDEFTGGLDTPLALEQIPQEIVEDVEYLESPVSRVLDYYGADFPDSPHVLSRLGLSPSLGGGGSGFGFGSAGGARATFGASAAGDHLIGGFLRSTDGPIKTSGYSVLTSSFSASAVSTNPLSGYEAFGDIASGSSATIAALSSASSPVRASRGASSSFLTSAALAGGYMSANSYLGRDPRFAGDSVMSASNTGGSIAVGGRPSIFAIAALSGTFRNGTLPPELAFLG